MKVRLMWLIVLVMLIFSVSSALAWEVSSKHDTHYAGFFIDDWELDGPSVNTTVAPHPDDAFILKPAAIDSVDSAHYGIYYSFSRRWLFNKDRIGLGLGFNFKFYWSYFSGDVDEVGADEEVKFPDDTRPDENASFAYANYQPWLITPGVHWNLYFKTYKKSYVVIQLGLPYHVRDELTFGYYRFDRYQEIDKDTWNGFGRRVSIEFGLYNSWTGDYLYLTLYEESSGPSSAKAKSEGISFGLSFKHDWGGK